MNSAISTKIRIGDSSKDFTLFNTSNQEWQLRKKLGQIVVLLFYPGNETLVCTKQLCSVRDNWAKYMDTGAEVVGISPGNEQEHAQFANNHHLPMPLLVDRNRSVTNIYGKHRWMPVWSTRA